jgi:hypothetical protein
MNDQPEDAESTAPENLRMWPEDILAKFPNLIRERDKNGRTTGINPYTGVGVHEYGPGCAGHNCVPFKSDSAAEALDIRKQVARADIRGSR